MELNNYQQDVMHHLADYLRALATHHTMPRAWQEYREGAERLRLPQFFVQSVPDLFSTEYELLERENLSAGFSLAGQDAQVSFDLIAALPNVLWWHRIIDRRGFRLNGFINHYPDFLVYTRSGHVLLIEAKGDNSDSRRKLRLGRRWQSEAGSDYRYFMVFESQALPADGTSPPRRLRRDSPKSLGIALQVQQKADNSRDCEVIGFCAI